jgi:NTP pyrophosphatase (non-canonical NTP hydrolase)
VSDLYHQAWESWGKEAQLKMLIEECSELIQAACKYGRKVNSSTLDHIAEEIADVEIMTEQTKQGLNLGNRVKTYKEVKLARLHELLKEEKSNDKSN